MKVRIKSFNGKLASFLTENKWYEVESCSDIAGYLFITDDFDYTRSITIKNCFYLNGGSWEVLE